MNRPSNLSFKKAKGAFVHERWSPILHPPKGWTIGYLMQSGPNNFLEHIEIGNSIDWSLVTMKMKKNINNWSHSVTSCDDEHHLLIVSIIRFTNVTRVFVSPNFIILPVWLLLKVKEFFLLFTRYFRWCLVIAQESFANNSTVVIFEYLSVVELKCNGRIFCQDLFSGFSTIRF